MHLLPIYPTFTLACWKRSHTNYVSATLFGCSTSLYSSSGFCELDDDELGLIQEEQLETSYFPKYSDAWKRLSPQSVRTRHFKTPLGSLSGAVDANDNDI